MRRSTTVTITMGVQRSQHPSPPCNEGRTPIVSLGNIFAIIDDGALRNEDYLEGERLVLAYTALHPGGIGALVIIPKGAKPPPEAQRKVIHSALLRLSTSVRALAWVIEGDGFAAAATRGVLMGLALYGRRSYPTHVSATIRDAFGWLARTLGRDASIGEIESAAEKLALARIG